MTLKISVKRKSVNTEILCRLLPSGFLPNPLRFEMKESPQFKYAFIGDGVGECH